MDGPQPTKYPEKGAFATAVGTCNQQVHAGVDLRGKGAFMMKFSSTPHLHIYHQ